MMALLKKKETHTEQKGTYRLTAYIEDTKRMVSRKRLEATYKSFDEAVKSAFVFDKKIAYQKIAITDDKNEECFVLWGYKEE